MRRGVIAAGVGLVVLINCAAASAWDGLFALNSYRNHALPVTAPIDPTSKIYVADLATKVRMLGVWVNTTRYSAPVYTVPPGTPTTQVAIADPSALGGPTAAALQSQFDDVPLPPDAEPAAGTDHSLVVYQTGGGGTLWEFWRFDRSSGQPTAAFGGRMDDVAANPGYFSDGFGATASGIPLLAGLQRISELQSGSIDHAVNVVVNQTGRDFRWPAQRTDGVNPLPSAVQEGMRFRFPPSLNIDALHLPHYATMVAKAIQTYGMVVTDTMRSSKVGVVFNAEDPTPTGSNPYYGPGGIFGGIYPSETGQFRDFPWNKLQLLRN